MARTSKVSGELRLAAVLSVLKGEATAVDAGRKVGVSEQTVHNWKRAFLDAGAEAMLHPKSAGKSDREMILEVQVEQLNAALGETVAELRVVKKGRSTREILWGSK